MLPYFREVADCSEKSAPGGVRRNMEQRAPSIWQLARQEVMLLCFRAPCQRKLSSSARERVCALIFVPVTV